MIEEWYDEEEDVFNIELTDGEYWKSIELPNGIVLDIDKNGKVSAIEILRASKIFSGDVRKVIESSDKENI